MGAKELVEIGTHLRLVALGIEAAHGLGLVHREVSRALGDARPDASGAVDASARRYVFRAVSGVRVEGRVEENEPETIWLVVDGHRGLERDLSRIVTIAKLCADQIEQDRASSGES